jgi:hypothetical protein
MMPPRTRVVLANAFSLSMLPMSSAETILRVKEVGIEEVKELLAGGYESAIGHESTAAFLTKLLGVEVKADRRQITIDTNTVLIVFQLMSRLPEGKVLNEQEMAEIRYRFYVVELFDIPPQRGLKGAVVDEIRNNWMRVRIGDKLYRIFAVCYQCGDANLVIESAPPQRG